MDSTLECLENGFHKNTLLHRIIGSSQKEHAKQDLHTAVSTAVSKGMDVLKRACDPVHAFQNTCAGWARDDLVEMEHSEEIFTSAMIVDLLSDTLGVETKALAMAYIRPKHTCGTCNYHVERQIPNDVDVTAVIHYILLREGVFESTDERMWDVGRVMALNTDADGVIQTYFPPRGHRDNRRCSGVIANALRYLYTIGFGGEARASEDYLFKHVQSGEYLHQCNYYPSPDVFLFFTARAIACNESAKHRFQDLLAESLKDRIGVSTYPLDVACRILGLAELDLLARSDIHMKMLEDVKVLLGMQGGDGAWPKDSLYVMARRKIFIGGCTISSAFAVAALLKIKAMQHASSQNGY